MKQTHLLILLLLLAAGAGTYLYRTAEQGPPPIDLSEERKNKVNVTSFLEKETGLSFPNPATIKIVSGPKLIEVVNNSFLRRFGPDGLKHRNRVFELIGLLPPGHSLEEELLIAETAAKPGWFDATSGIIYLHEQFQGIDSAEQAAFVHLKARALLHQHDPPDEELTDDAYKMREAIHGGLASILEGKFRATGESNIDLPSQAEMEREAALLSLPIYLHNLIQLPAMQGKDYVQKQLQEGNTIQAILDGAPENTLALFSEQLPTNESPSIELPDTILNETLGAYTTQLIGERFADYVFSEMLAKAWRGDWYFYSTDEQGENLCWISQWDSSDTAKKLEEILQRELIPTNEINTVFTNPFIRQTDGSLIVIFYSDQKSLKEIILQFQQNN